MLNPCFNYCSEQSRDGTALGAQCSTEVPCTYFYCPKILFPYRVSVQLKAYPLFAVLCLVAQSRLTLCDLMDCSPPGSSVHRDSPGKNTGVPCLSPVDLPNPGTELRSPAWQADSSPSEPPGKPKNTGVGSLPFSRGSS